MVSRSEHCCKLVYLKTTISLPLENSQPKLKFLVLVYNYQPIHE